MILSVKNANYLRDTTICKVGVMKKGLISLPKNERPPLYLKNYSLFRCIKWKKTSFF